jgi:hypothetical protein
MEEKNMEVISAFEIKCERFVTVRNENNVHVMPEKEFAWIMCNEREHNRELNTAA